MIDKLEQILSLELKIHSAMFVRVNIYNANSENDQCQTLPYLSNILVKSKT